MWSTREVIDRLREEGFDVSYSYLQWLIRDRILEPPEERFGGSMVWAEADIQRLTGELTRRGRGPAEEGVTR